MHTSANATVGPTVTANDIYPQQDDSPAFMHGYQPLILPPLLTSPQNQHRQSTVSRRSDHHSISIPPQQRQHIIHHYPSRQPTGICASCYPFCCRIFVRRYKERSKRIDVVSRLVRFY